MNTKLLCGILITLFIGIFSVFITVANAKGLNLYCSKNKNLVVTLKSEAEIEKSQIAISKVPQVKIIKITYRDKEWSKMVNKMDLPNMDNPFKNEFLIKIGRNADSEETLNKIKKMNFVENAQYVSDIECKSKF